MRHAGARVPGVRCVQGGYNITVYHTMVDEVRAGEWACWLCSTRVHTLPQPSSVAVWMRRQLSALNPAAQVELYRKHWWSCDRCGAIVKRAMNRPPQPADCRWAAVRTQTAHAGEWGGPWAAFALS